MPMQETHQPIQQPAKWPVRDQSTDTAALIERYLGPGESHPGETFWRITKFGRPCLLYLHTWANRSQTVTSLDVARPPHQMIRHIEVNTPAKPGVADLVAELRSLTSWRAAQDESAPMGRI